MKRVDDDPFSPSTHNQTPQILFSSSFGTTCCFLPGFAMSENREICRFSSLALRGRQAWRENQTPTTSPAIPTDIGPTKSVIQSTDSETALIPASTVGRVHSARNRTIGRLEGLKALETDKKKATMLEDIGDQILSQIQHLDRPIGKLESHAKLEVVTAKRMIVECIIRDLEQMKGKWC